MSVVATIAVLCGLYLNLPLQCGIGVREIFDDRENHLVTGLVEAALLFISLFLEWCFFVYIISPLGIGFVRYFILLPLAAVVPVCVSFIFKREVGTFPHRSGAGIAAMMIILSLGGNATEAATEAASISLGIFFCVLILRAIRFKLERERVNAMFRGVPLLLIAMGILSLAITAAAVIYLR